VRLKGNSDSVNSSNLFIERLPSGPLSTNAYLLVSQEDVVVVDPGPKSAETIDGYLQRHGKKLTAIWLTHSHWDHIADCAEVVSHHPVPVMVHRLDADNLIHPGSDGIPCPFPLTAITSFVPIGDGDRLALGSGAWEVLHTPGHSVGSVCFYNSEEAILLSGDTLFKGTMGNISFPTSAPSLMADTLARLSALPLATVILPGHGPQTTIAQERPWMMSYVTTRQKH
jgi:glyoxylase-like metal-dependent hydrolase (beta-lactamase superfamily II)